MDLHLPKLDGIAATRAIRALPDTARSTVPIVALTADAFESTRDRCLVAGMNGFLSKPLKPESLATALRRLFGPLVPAVGVFAASQGPGNRRPTAAASAGTGGPEGAAPVAPAATAPTAPTAAITATPAADDHVVTLPVDLLQALPAAPAVDALVDMAAVRLLLQALSQEQYALLAQRYFEQAPHTARRLRAAVRDGQPLDLRANAHAAKGAALNLGLAALATTAHALQQGASHLPAHEIARLVQRFDDQTQATFDELRAQGLVTPAPAVVS